MEHNWSANCVGYTAMVYKGSSVTFPTIDPDCDDAQGPKHKLMQLRPRIPGLRKIIPDRSPAKDNII